MQIRIGGHRIAWTLALVVTACAIFGPSISAAKRGDRPDNPEAVCFQQYAIAVNATATSTTTATTTMLLPSPLIRARFHCVIVRTEQDDEEHNGDAARGDSVNTQPPVNATENDSWLQTIAASVLKANDTEREIMHERMRYLSDVDYRSREGVDVRLPSVEDTTGAVPSTVVTRIGRTRRDGHVEATIELPPGVARALATPSTPFDVVVRDSHNRSSEQSFRVIGQAKLLMPIEQPNGYAIFSDLDDTIKRTQVLDYSLLFENTFMRPFLPELGMPELYRSLVSRLSVAETQTPPMIFYVSGSPWQLLSPIQTFLDEHYPLGELVLNRLNFKDTSFLRFMATGKYKVEAFRERHLLFPAKKWYLIGDAGHTDPETFAEIYKRWGSDVIACIWIKTVHGTNTAKELQRNAMSRFNKTFAEVPRERWNIFSNPASIQELPAGKCV